ncbi:hypothetical protein JW826_00745 [Candidatus Woesearchaeota archaeon]|nr:hypothetical protein [Candidatus Woesearchaeota archaeon]
MVDEIMRQVQELARSSMINPGLRDHGWPHIIRVFRYSGRIGLAEFGDDILLQRDCHVAALFHDVSREYDEYDDEHGERSARIFESLQTRLPVRDAPSIAFAIRHHCEREAPNGGFPVVENFAAIDSIDKRIAACLWDADRLDLLRVHSRVDPAYLSLGFSRAFANSQEHRASYSGLRSY